MISDPGSAKGWQMSGGQSAAMDVSVTEARPTAAQPSSGKVDLQRAFGLRWFQRSVVFGFVINMLFAIPAVFAPRFLETLLRVNVTNTPEWLQNVGVLLMIISVMYIPAIKDPFRYLFNAYLLVAGRFSAGVLFLSGLLFMNYPSGFVTLAASDLVLSPLQAFFLYKLLRGSAGADPGRVGSR